MQVSRVSTFLTLTLLVPVLLVAGQENDEKRYIGFKPEGTVKQRELEERTRKLVDPENCRAILKELSNTPNMAGTPGDRKNAEFFHSYLTELGLKSTIYPYHVYLPYPKGTTITLEGDTTITLTPGEAGVDSDPDSHPLPYPPYNAFSPSGDVRGEVVYANYARSQDFELLAEKGIDVKGKVVIARYGGIFRGSKTYEAEKHGAAALIIYSDPINDGYYRGDVYPEGPMRPADGIQRGSIYYMFNTPGDPLTPMIPALKDAERIKPEEAGLPQVPTTPLSYGDARKILSRLKGEEVPQEWQGALPFRYHVGPGPVTARVTVDTEFELREIWNVVGILEGNEYPDQWILIGCHRDAWLNGAQDPHSGNAVILEMIRALVTAAKETDGYRRSIAICSWDAEEFGVIGSVEWVEQMRDTLNAKSVVYINADAMVSGSSFRASATPTMRAAFQQVLAENRGADGEIILEKWQNQRVQDGKPAGQYSFGLMGGGSDHLGFLFHVGVPCVSAGYGGRSGVYHSAYDTFAWMEKFGDPGFKAHASGARLLSSLVSRVANAEVIPYSPSDYVKVLRDMIEKEMAQSTAEQKTEFENVLTLVDDIEAMSRTYEKELALRLDNETLSKEQRDELNRVLLTLERSFIDESGVPGREWNRNLIFATDTTNGYGLETLPAFRSVKNQPEQSNFEIKRLKKAIMQYRNTIARAITILLVAKGE